jgi:hypothetical protein
VRAMPGSTTAAAVCAVTVLGLAGCSADGGGDAARSSDPSAGAMITPSGRPSAVPTAGPRQKLVTMTVSGGFAGVRREVVVRGDGTVRTTDEGDTEVRRSGAARFARLRTLLADPALDDVPASTVDRGAADLFRYTLRFDGRTVVTDRSVRRPSLDRLIDALEEWLPT